MRIIGKIVAVATAFVAVLVGVLVAIDSLHSRTCFSAPTPGTEIAVPGERMVVLDSQKQDGKDVLVLDVIRDPFEDKNYGLPPEHGHLHPNQEERFEVVSGRARFLIGDEYVNLGPGESGVVPPNTNHHWMALDDEPVRVTAYFEPSLDVDMWFLHFQQHVASGSMNLLQAAVITREFSESSPLPADPPPAVASFLMRVLAPIGRMSGYQACEP